MVSGLIENGMTDLSRGSRLRSPFAFAALPLREEVSVKAIRL